MNQFDVSVLMYAGGLSDNEGFHGGLEVNLDNVLARRIWFSSQLQSTLHLIEIYGEDN